MPDPSPHPLSDVGWSVRVETLFAPLVDRGLEPGRVVLVERGWCRLATGAGERSLPVPGLAVGDWVGVDGDSVGEVLPRWSALARLDPDEGRQVLAANVDVVLIAAPGDRLSSARVERELVVAWDSGARPIVVVTKLDVTPPGAVADLMARLGAVDVIATSSVAGSGLDQVRAVLIHPVTAVWLGPSGAGKSTLINALLGEDRLLVRAVRADDHRGRHTTTSRQLVRLPSGGSLIDMPGLRSLGTDATEESLAAAFADIDDLAGGCRFTDCAHEVEPGCAVVAAATAGHLDPTRLSSYRKLSRETNFERRRVDPTARREEAQAWKAIKKRARRHKWARNR